MSVAQASLPNWGGWMLRAVIYGAFAALLFWWHPVLGLVASAFILADLIHHAADTTRQRSGYVLIPRHPSMPGTPKTILKPKALPLAILFAIVWLICAVAGRLMLESSWPEARTLALAPAGMAAIAAALMFPAAARGLLWMLSITIGLALSLGDLAAMFMGSPKQRNAWHRTLDQADHRLADLVLGQPAVMPLRADLAERAVEQARAAKGAK